MTDADRERIAARIAARSPRDRRESLRDRMVREQIEMLRGSDEAALGRMASALARKRLAWLDGHRPEIPIGETNLLEAAYGLLLLKLGIAPEDAPVVERGAKHLVFRSQNFCPTLEACRILGLDTRFVCRHLTESPTAEFLARIDPRLRFSRNYITLRPHGPWCEERIFLGVRFPRGSRTCLGPPPQGRG